MCLRIAFFAREFSRWLCSSSGTGMASCAREKSELSASSQDPHQYAQNLRVLAWINDNGIHRVVGRFKANVVFFLVKALKGDFIVDHGDDALAVGGRLLLLNYNVIAVLDVAINHRVAVYLQDEAVGTAE